MLPVLLLSEFIDHIAESKIVDGALSLVEDFEALGVGRQGTGSADHSWERAIAPVKRETLAAVDMTLRLLPSTI